MCLDEDIEELPGKHNTELGADGINLSGGQKARVALARAVYQRKALTLLDDPLAALDPRVAEKVLDWCIVKLLRQRGCILVTHNVSALQRADRIYLMQDGRISESGGPEALAALHADRNDAALDYGGSDLPGDSDEKTKEGAAESDAGAQETSASTSKAEDGKLIEEEERGVGVVALHVYATYWRAVGGGLAVAVLAALLLMQGSRNVSDWWLSHWVTEASKVGCGQGY